MIPTTEASWQKKFHKFHHFGIARKRRVAAEAEEQRRMDEEFEKSMRVREEMETAAMLLEDVRYHADHAPGYQITAYSSNDWESFETPSGELYWYNRSTGESTWDYEEANNKDSSLTVSENSPLSFINERGNRVFMIPRGA